MDVSPSNSSQPGNNTEPKIIFLEPSAELIKRYDRQTTLIIGVLTVALLTMVIMTGTLILDSFHFNSAAYQEYSTRFETNQVLLETNKTYQEQVLKTLEEFKQSIKNLERK